MYEEILFWSSSFKWLLSISIWESQNTAFSIPEISYCIWSMDGEPPCFPEILWIYSKNNNNKNNKTIFYHQELWSRV